MKLSRNSLLNFYETNYLMIKFAPLKFFLTEDLFDKKHEYSHNATSKNTST